MKKFDIAAIGELNIDVILNGIESEPEIGKEKFVSQMTLTLGSSTAIFAANAATLGSKVSFVGMIGQDIFGTLVENSLKERKVDTSLLVKSPEVTTGATIVMNYGEDRANLTYQGAMDVMDYDDINPSIFKNAKHIHLSSLFMQSGLLKDIDKILTKAKENNVTVSLDTQWDPLEKWAMDWKKVLPLVTVFLPNETELMALTKTNDIEAAINTVTPYLGHIMVVKMGSKGSLLIYNTGKRQFLASFLNKEVVDAIGAGDSFNAGFINAFVAGHPAEDCQRNGNLTGAINTTAAGGTGAFVSRQAAEECAKQKFNTELL